MVTLKWIFGLFLISLFWFTSTSAFAETSSTPDIPTGIVESRELQAWFIDPSSLEVNVAASHLVYSDSVDTLRGNSRPVISTEINKLKELTASACLKNEEELLGILTVADDAVRDSAEEAQSGEPSLAINSLRIGKVNLQEYRKSLSPKDYDQQKLAKEAGEIESRVDGLLTRYDTSVRSLIGDLLLWEGNRHSIGRPEDITAFGPAVIAEEQFQIYLKTKEGALGDSDIDDLTATCGIWICPGDTCLCTEWECTGDGPGGSFP